MSDFEDHSKLAVVETIKDGVAIGIKNILPITVNIILWALTFWIPYLNVGTTIGVLIGIVSKASKGEPIPMTEIFNSKYRKYMGEFFLTAGLTSMGVSIATLFLFIPGIVVGLAWSLALLIAVDKGKNPTEAISLSNKCTYGYKFKMICVFFITSVLFGIALAIPIAILGAVSDGGIAFAVLTGFVLLVGALLFCFICIGLWASIYRQLTNDIGEDVLNYASVQPAPAHVANVSAPVQPPPQVRAVPPPPKAEAPRTDDQWQDFGYDKPKSKLPLVLAIVAALILAAGGAYFFVSQPNTATLFEVGRSFFDAQNYTEAVNYFSQAINRNQRDAELRNYRGRAYFELKNFDAALADFSEAARLDPNTADHHFRMGETFTAMGNHQSAIAAYSEAIRIEPGNAQYHFSRGDANNANKMFEASIADYTQAIRLDPTDARFFNNRGGTYRQMENYAAAIIDYNEAIRLNPNDARYRNNRGVAHYLGRNHPAAIADYTAAIQLAPNNARYRNNRGQVHSLMRNHAAAVEDFREALRLDPGSEQYRTNLEQAQERLQRQQQQQFGNAWNNMGSGHYGQQRLPAGRR